MYPDDLLVGEVRMEFVVVRSHSNVANSLVEVLGFPRRASGEFDDSRALCPVNYLRSSMVSSSWMALLNVATGITSSRFPTAITLTVLSRKNLTPSWAAFSASMVMHTYSF